MKRTRIINLIALLVNLGIVGCFFAGFYFQFLEECIKDFNKISSLGTTILNQLKDFVFIVAILNFVASLCMIFANSKSMKRMRDSTPRWVFTLRYIAMGLSAVVFFLAIISIITNKDLKVADVFVTGSSLYWVTLMPLASMLCFVLLELEQTCKFRKNFGPLICSLAYSIGIVTYMFILISKSGIEAAVKFCPSYIYLLTKDLIAAAGYTGQLTVVTTRSVLAVITIISFAIPALLWLLNKIISSLIIGYEYVEIDGDDKVVRPINKPIKQAKQPKPIIKKKIINKPTKPVHYDNVYRVSINDIKLRNWKVMLPNKQIKVFNTQQEALAFASYHAKKSKGTVRVHTALAKLKYERQ